MAKKRFQPIVIKSQEELDDILEQTYDRDLEFLEAVQYVQDPTLEQQLDKWLNDNGIDLCNTGEKKILKAAKAGIITTWPQYFEKHWNDSDGILDWLEKQSNTLVGEGVDTFRSEYARDGSWLDYANFPSFASFRRANPGLKFIAWPFKTKKSSRKSKR